MTTEHSTEEPETGPAWLARLTRASQLINLAGVSVAAVLVTMMTGLILLEISLRVFSLSTQITDVWVAYAVAAVTFLSAPWVLEQNSMLKVAILVQALPSQTASGRRILRRYTDAWCQHLSDFLSISDRCEADPARDNERGLHSGAALAAGNRLSCRPLHALASVARPLIASPRSSREQ